MIYKSIYLLLILVTVVSCGQETTHPKLEKIELGVSYIPNVQFAPFYVAQAKGFYADEGLDVYLEYGFETDFVTLTAKGERQFAVASGDQVILGRAQKLPLVYVMKWYERFPVAVIAPKSSGITSPVELANHSVGIPGPFGASYVAWQALVYTTGLDDSTVTLESIGFTQAEAISTNQVDAAVVYIANEPILLSQQGIEVNMFEVSDYIDLVSNGIITNETVVKENPELVRRLIRASLRGIQYTIEHPDEAFEISRQVITDMTDEDAPTQRLVLDVSISLWKSEHLGITSSQAWSDSVNFMQEVGMIDTKLDVETLFTNEFVEN